MMDVIVADAFQKYFEVKTIKEKHKITLHDEDVLLYIQSGFVKMALKNDARSITIAGKDEIIGGPGSSYTITAISDVIAYQIHLHSICEVIMQAPEISQCLVRALTKTILSREKQLYVMGKRLVRERVAGTLLNLFETFQCDDATPESSVIYLDKTTIADLSNTTLETLSRTLTELENKGVLRRVGNYIGVLKKIELLKYFNG